MDIFDEMLEKELAVEEERDKREFLNNLSRELKVTISPCEIKLYKKLSKNATLYTYKGYLFLSRYECEDFGSCYCTYIVTTSKFFRYKRLSSLERFVELKNSNKIIIVE